MGLFLFLLSCRMAEDVKKKLKRFGLSGLKKLMFPKQESHIVAVRWREGELFDSERGATVGKPKFGESARMKAKRKSSNRQKEHCQG